MIDFLVSMESRVDLGDCVNGSKYKQLGANPDSDGVLWLSLIISADGAPVNQKQVNKIEFLEYFLHLIHKYRNSILHIMRLKCA